MRTLRSLRSPLLPALVAMVLAVIFIASSMLAVGDAAAFGAPLLAGDQPRLPLQHVSVQSQAFVPGRLVVKFRPGISFIQRRSRLEAEGIALQKYLSPLDVDLVSVPVGQELTWARKLEEDPSVLYAEPDYIAHILSTKPNDTYYATYQWNMPHIGLETAWDTTTGSSDVTIAIVDTGVDLTHPDLSSKIVSGYDFVNNDSDPSDDEGHGTHVAGIAAAATNNNRGVAGVSWNS
ncbi:MAG: S8 family serine peptidase [Anaerolineae bacterium]|nr:S8 family serine peptidase [Anaerolineae bacterium]